MKKKLDFWDILLRVMYAVIGIGVLIGLFIALRVYVVDQFVIPTDSMRPTLIPGGLRDCQQADCRGTDLRPVGFRGGRSVGMPPYERFAQSGTQRYCDF